MAVSHPPSPLPPTSAGTSEASVAWAFIFSELSFCLSQKLLPGPEGKYEYF